MRREKIFSVTSLLILLYLFIIFIIAGCSNNPLQSECEQNNTGTLTVKNNTNDDIKVLIDGISYGFISIGETLEKEFSAGIKYTVETLWPDGSPACSAAEVTVVQCEKRGIVCSAVH